MAIISKTPFNFKLRWGELTTKVELDKDVSQKSDGFLSLVVGLGNIGEACQGTRHNIGFEVIDQYAKKNNFPDFKQSKKFFGLISEKIENGKKTILLKPTTLMNLSGKSIRSVAEFYNIKPEDITVVHDELDLDFGVIKDKKGGQGKSSHNGLKSVSSSLKSNNYKRLRFGIKNSNLGQIESKDFVLGRFNKEEQKHLHSLLKEACELI